jgi:hypothetical protein
VDDHQGCNIRFLCHIAYFVISLLYDTLCESEHVEDTTRLSPCRVIKIQCPVDKDVKIRLNIYYSSNLTSGKEMLLAGTAFSIRDVLRRNLAIFDTIMVSEHCKSPRAQIRLLHVQDQILILPEFSSVSPQRIKPPNPLIQSYIFYPDVPNVLPVNCEERCFEPRMAFKVPNKFLQNLSSMLKETIKRWQIRYEVERIRLGCFTCKEEAFMNGWQELVISIGGCRIECQYHHDQIENKSDNGVATTPIRPSTHVRVYLEDK